MPPKKYTAEDKEEAMNLLRRNRYDYRKTSAALGISIKTLKKWRERYHEERLQSVLHQMEDLHAELIGTATEINQAISKQIEKAPLNQLSSALGVLVDRYMKVDEYLGEIEQLSEPETEEDTEKTVRIVYKSPNGSISRTPPWSDRHSELGSEVQGGGLREEVREDQHRSRNNNDKSNGKTENVVARPDLSNGRSHLEGTETDIAGLRRSEDQRNKPPD